MDGLGLVEKVEAGERSQTPERPAKVLVFHRPIDK